MDIGGMNLQHLFIVFMRVGGFVFTAPVFSAQLIPRAVKVWFSLVLAMVILPVVGSSGDLTPLGTVSCVLLAGREVLLGVLMGLVCSLFVYGVEFGGHVIGLQMGFGASTLFDPLSRVEASAVGRFQGLLALTLFLVINGHHAMLQSFAASYRVVPPSLTAFAGAGGRELIAVSGTVFAIAVRASMPVLLALLMAQLGVGLLAKTMPQMNVFVIGFPVKIALGLTVVGISIPYFTYVLAKEITQTNGELNSLLRAISGG